MTATRNLDRLLLLLGLLLGLNSCAHAYIDPGSASVIYTVGLAPVLAFLGLIGRKVVRMIRRSKPEEASAEGEERGDQPES